MRKSSKVFFYIGFLLILSSLGLVVFLQMQTSQAQTANSEIVQAIDSALPERREGLKDDLQNMEMPALEIGGEDYIALLEIPSVGCRLPVYGSWDKGKVFSHPCRFSGTVYDGSLIVGGYDRPGQFDFFDYISKDDPVMVTDMRGSVFSYVVDQMEYSGSAEAEVLTDSEADLTLFVRDARLMKYVILRCVEK